MNPVPRGASQLTNSLTFLSWNVDGLWNKLADPDFMEYVSSFDVVCLFETFLNITFFPPEKWANFCSFSCPAVKLSHQGRSSGGIVVLIRKEYFDFVSRVDVSCDQVLVLKLAKSLFETHCDVFLVACYVPPTDSPFYKDSVHKCQIHEIEQCLASVLERFGDALFLMCGDFNGRTANLQPNPDVFKPDPEQLLRHSTDMFIHNRQSDDSVVNPFGRHLLNVCACFELLILNGFCNPELSKQFTFVSSCGASVNDYFIMSTELVPLCANLKVDERVESVHMPLLLSVSCSQSQIDTNARHDKTQSDSYAKMTWNPDKAHILTEMCASSVFQNHIALANTQVEDSVDVALQTFTKAIKEAAACMTKNIRPHDGHQSDRHTQPWYDQECRTSKKSTKKALRNFNKKKTNENRIIYVEERKNYKRLLRTKEKEFKKNTVDKLINSCSNSEAFWKEIKKHRRKVRVQNNITEGAWFQHFSTVLNENAELNEDNVQFTEENNSEDMFHSLNVDITENEVRASLKHAKSGKAAGPDGIINEVLKVAEPTIVPFLTKYFNVIFSTSVFPEEWTKAIIFPLHKKGDVNNPDNYRGIALISCISKLYTHILNKRLTDWAEMNDKISDTQAGFRKNYSTLDHIFTVFALVQKQFLSDRKVYVSFVDFRKAFDTVKRHVLWNILSNLGVCGKMLLALQSMYKSVRFCVMDKMTCTDYFECLQGLKQGCLASPTLFTFLINELASYIISHGRHGFQFRPGAVELFLLMFADDIALFSSTPRGLQTQLNNLHTIATRLGLSVNVNKTKIIVFRKGGPLSRHEKWTYGTQNVEVVNVYKYLGLNFSTRLSIKVSVEDIVIKAKKCVVDIFKTLWKLNCTSPTIFFKLFDAQVVPILLYASEIWGTNELDEIEKVHLFACKRLLNVGLRTPNQMVYGELGRYPLFVMASTRCVSFWLRLCELANNRYSKMAYLMLKGLDEREKETWASEMKMLLYTNGFGHVWLSQGVGNKEAFLKVFKQQMSDCAKQNWSSKLSDSERFTLYSSFKSSLQREKYFDVVTSHYVRNMYIKFRLNISDLNCNRYRYHSNFFNLNACHFCPDAKEDETHFLFYCPIYNHLRAKYLAGFDLTYYRSRQLSILSADNIQSIVNIAKFIFYAFKFRATKLEL